MSMKKKAAVGLAHRQRQRISVIATEFPGEVYHGAPALVNGGISECVS